MDHFKGNIIWTKAKKLVYYTNKKHIKGYSFQRFSNITLVEAKTQKENAR